MDETLRKKLKRSDISPAEAMQLYIRAGQLDKAHEVISNIRLGSAEFEVNVLVQKGYLINSSDIKDICLDEESLIAYLNKILAHGSSIAGLDTAGWEEDYEDYSDEDPEDAEEEETIAPHPVLNVLARAANNPSFLLNHWPGWGPCWNQILVFKNPLTNTWIKVSSAAISQGELAKLSQHSNATVSHAAVLYLKHLVNIENQAKAADKRKEELAQERADRERHRLLNSLVVVNFEAAIDTRIGEMWDLYCANQDKPQKDFANGVKQHPLSHLLFKARTENITKKEKFRNLVRSQDIVRMAHRYNDNRKMYEASL